MSMPKPADNQTVAERISGGFADLTRAERQLASHIMAGYPVAGLGSMTHLALAASVSTPTVVRMAKKLGFSGFPDLQSALRDELEATLSNPIAKHDRWLEAAPDTHILNRFADAVMENLRVTLQNLDRETFDATVSLLSDSDRTIFMLGGRITHSLAEYFFTHLQVMRAGAVLMGANANTWPHFLLDMKHGDVVIAFDIRRYENDIMRFAELARERGVTLVLLTDHWGSPAAALADHVFHARIEAPSAWDSSAVLLFIVESLIAAVQNGTWETTRRRMDALETLFDRTRLFRKFV